VQVIELGKSDNGYFMTMEFVHGRDLRSLVRAVDVAGDTIPLGCTLTIVVALAAGLHYAHERQGHDGRPLGLVHRDVSPSNVIVSYDGVVKLVDFGVAKAAARTVRTRATALKGKIGYMSPEQCRGLPVDRRSDVFSLGVLLYELTTLQRPFHEDNHFAALNRIVAGKFERPTAVLAGYPPGLEEIVLRTLAAEPSERYPTARALLTDLEQFAHAQGLLLSATALSDWVSETCGRPPFPTYEPPAPEPIAPPSTEPEPAPRRGASMQMWLVGGLLLTTAMSTLALVLALSRQPAPTVGSELEREPEPPTAAAAPAPTPQARDETAASTPRVAEPKAETTGAALPVAAEPSAPNDVAPASSGKSVAPRKKKPRRPLDKPATPEKPTSEKPTFDSIFPPK
jgi:serine/threonine protein kinase